MSQDSKAMLVMKSMSRRFVLEVMLLDKTSESGRCFSAIFWYVTSVVLYRKDLFKNARSGELVVASNYILWIYK